MSKQLNKPKTNRNETVGKYMLDISKLTFASFILGSIFSGELPQYVLIAAGAVVSIGTVILGVLLTTKKLEEKE